MNEKPLAQLRRDVLAAVVVIAVVWFGALLVHLFLL
jgi:hypothetical protein